MPNLQPSIDNAEHIGPSTTGDNVMAKRVVSYVWDGANWQRMIQPGEANPKPTAYDTITYTSNTTSDVYVYTLSGVTVATQTINYTATDKLVITTVVWS